MQVVLEHRPAVFQGDLTESRGRVRMVRKPDGNTLRGTHRDMSRATDGMSVPEGSDMRGSAGGARVFQPRSRLRSLTAVDMGRDLSCV